MTKTRITYFSQDGTTEKVARAIGEGLIEKGHDVDFYSMNGSGTPDLGGVDVLGVGLPVYYFRPPFKVMDVLSELPDLNGLPVFVFLLLEPSMGIREPWYEKCCAKKAEGRSGIS